MHHSSTHLLGFVAYPIWPSEHFIYTRLYRHIIPNDAPPPIPAHELYAFLHSDYPHIVVLRSFACVTWERIARVARESFVVAGADSGCIAYYFRWQQPAAACDVGQSRSRSAQPTANYYTASKTKRAELYDPKNRKKRPFFLCGTACVGVFNRGEFLTTITKCNLEPDNLAFFLSFF